MMHEKMRRGDRGVVLIVVVGVLAILSLLAATFGMVTRLELAASRNTTEYEMARQAAHAGEESLINALQSWLNGGSMTSGALPTFFPNAADTDGVLLYKRDGVKVYFAANDTVPAGSVTPDWLQGLGLQDAGMFNINAMGFANDLGSNCNPDIRYTSFDCSLVRLLTSRFASIAAANPTDFANLMAYDANFNAVNADGILTEQQRLAILLSRAIINWRHGPDLLPGSAGTEERRLGHLPRWNNKLGCTNVNQGVNYGFPPGGVNTKYDWGWDDSNPFVINPVTGLPYPNYFLPSLFINATAVLGPVPWSYFEPGVWSSFQGTGSMTPWGNDMGLPVPGLFWGKMAPGSNATSVIAYNPINPQPGWRDWPTNTWNGYTIYVATGPSKWQMATITSNTATTLTLAAPGLVPPPSATGGDAFCIFPLQELPGQLVTALTPNLPTMLNKRWVPGDLYVEGDLVPNAMLWPDGTLATEGNVFDLSLYSGVVAAAVNLPSPSLTDANATAWQFATWAAQYPNKSFVVHIYGGTGRGQVRTIQTPYPTVNPLTVTSPWTIIPDVTSQYRIELPDDNLPAKFQPNNLQGDDRLYLSLGALRDSVVVPALVNDGLTTANAQGMADILLPYILPYLSVSTQAIQASQSLCSINDWAVDGVDNNANGVVDDPLEAQYEVSSPQNNNVNRAFLAQSLYKGLGLYTWAHANTNPVVTATRVQQAAQLVANIIDFRDPTDVPTLLKNKDLNETAVAIPNFAVYGAKGLHVTQVMPTPDAIYSSTTPPGWEMTLDGQNPPVGNPVQLSDGKDWDWNGTAWVDKWGNPDLDPVATFTFPNLKPGFYAMRLIGSNNTTFRLTYQPPWTTTTEKYYALTALPDPEVPATWSTGFVRKNDPTIPAPGNPLACFQVGSDGNLTFQLQTTDGAQFRGFALCAQYIQLTNISTHDIRLDGLTVTTDQTQILTTAGPGVIPWQASGNYLRAASLSWPAYGGNPIDLRRIPGAAVGTPGFLSGSGVPPTLSVATYPINYGTYVICMSEESYEKQWSAQNDDPDFSTNPGFNPGFNKPPFSTNGDGIWGDERNEVYPIYPFGDLSTDADTMALLMGAKGTATAYNPSVTVKDVALDLIAGGSPTAGPGGVAAYVDGAIPSILNAGDVTDANCYSAIEKTMVLQPTWDVDLTNYLTNKYWRLYTYPNAPVALAASQNTLVIAQDDAPRIPTGTSTSFRACLNRSYGYHFLGDNPADQYVAIWDPTITPPTVTNPWDPTMTWPPASMILWNTAKRWATLAKPSFMASQSRIFPFVLNRPYPTTGWLGLVPTSNTDALNSAISLSSLPPPVPTGYVIPTGSWRTIDPNPWPSTGSGGAVLPYLPQFPEQLLGTLMSNATVGGVYARFNINTAPVDTLKAVFSDADALQIITRRGSSTTPTRVQGAVPVYNANLPACLGNNCWTNWDELLIDNTFQNSVNAGLLNGIGYYDAPESSGISNADAGAGTYADGFPDSSNEKKEWFMRFANLFTLQSTSYQFTVAGLVYVDRPWDMTTMQNNEPVAMVRIEVNVDLSNQAGPSVVHFRYLAQQ